MKMMKLIRIMALTAALIFTSFGAACVQGPPEGGKQHSGSIRIGISMDTLKEERWQRDRDLFVARAKELGAEVLVQSANGDDRVQTQQADNLLTQGIDALVVIPHNGEIPASIVENAKAKHVPVVSYDRL